MNLGKWISDHTGSKGVVLGLIGVFIGVIGLAVTFWPVEEVSAPDADIRQGEVVIGYTVEKHRKLLETREAELTAEIEAASGKVLETMRQQLLEVRRQLTDFEDSFKAREAELRRLRAQVADAGSGIAQERIEAAQTALYEGDTALADQIFAEIESMEQESIDRAANAAYQRGQIAENEIRWHDAAVHYERAAKLSPSYQHLERAGTFFWRSGQYQKKARIEEELFELSKRENGPNSAKTAVAMNNLALAYKILGRYDEAEPLYRQAIEIDKATIGEEHPDYAIGLNNLALLLKNMGRYEEAEPLYRQAIQIGKATIGERHPGYATRLNNLASLLQDMGRYEEAESLYRQAIEIDKATIGEEHPDYAIGLNNLALLLLDIGKPEEAKTLWRQMHAINLTALGLEHPQTSTGAASYARLLRAHFPDDPALKELEATFGPDTGKQ